MSPVPPAVRWLPILVLSLVLAALPAAAGWKLDDVIGSDTISLSLEHRYRYEGLSDPFQAANNGKAFTDLISMRTLLHARVTLPEGFSVGAELEDSRTFLDNDVLLNSTHVNTAELLQAYVRYDGDVEGGRIRARAGRITMDVGSRRLVARNRFRNTINGFTGIDLDWQGAGDRNGLNLRAFFTLPVQREPNPQVAANLRRRLGDNDVVFDREDFGNLFWGVFAARDFDRFLGLEGVRGELYLFGLHESDSGSRPTRNRNLYTPGFRLVRKPAKEVLDFQLEAIVQVGQSRRNTTTTSETDHTAFFVHSALGYSFDAPGAPRVAFQLDYASGDSSPTDGNTERFDTLFGARRFEFGPTGIYGAFARSNLVTPGLRVQVSPVERVDAFAAVRTFWLASKNDAWAGGGVVDPLGESGDHVGTQIEWRVRWFAVPDTVLIEAGYAHLFAGEYIDTNSASSTSNRQGDSDYFYTQAKFNF